MDFHNNLVTEETLPTEMTIEGRTYDILGFLREGETSVVGRVMVERAKEMSANLGQDDGQHLLDNQKDIPAILRGQVFVFTDWYRPGYLGRVYSVCWDRGHWTRGWGSRGSSSYWGEEGDYRVLRRK